MLLLLRRTSMLGGDPSKHFAPCLSAVAWGTVRESMPGSVLAKVENTARRSSTPSRQRTAGVTRLAVLLDKSELRSEGSRSHFISVSRRPLGCRRVDLPI